MKSKNAILLVAGIGAIAGVVVIAKRAYAQPPPGTSAPQGSITLVANKTRMKLSGDGALFTLPNDATFFIQGTVTAGNPAPSAQIILEIADLVGGWINIGTFTPSGTFAVGQIVQYSRFLTPTDLQLLLGFVATSYTARARMILTNSVGSVTAISSTVVFTVNAPPPPVTAPAGTTTISVTKVATRSLSRRWTD